MRSKYMSTSRILYYDLETKDIVKIVREVDSSVIHPYYEVEFDDIKEFVDGTKVQSQYYVELIQIQMILQLRKRNTFKHKRN